MELISAAKNGNFELAFNLLRSGCSTNVCDKDNATPLYWSACHGHTNICEILIQSGSDVNTRVKWGSTALHAAADRGHRACIEVLLDSDASVNARNSRGDTALHIAAYRGHIDIIMTLLRAKADVTLRNEKGKTPQQEALEGGHRQIAENIVNFTNGTLLGPIPMTTSNDVTCVSLRQASEVSDEDHCHTYENGSCTKRLHGPLQLLRQNSMDTPPPRPPLNLTRSISLSDPHVRSQDGFMPLGRLPDNLIEPRTSSFTRVNEDDVSSDVIFNNVTRNYRAEELVEGSVFAPQNDSMSQASFLTESSAYSSGASWNNTSHSENDVITTMEPIATSRDFAQVPLRLNPSLTRPNRSSIGSIREISNNCPDISSSANSQGFMLTLQSQLVESYRTIERLTAENESLKFKCSTLLSRLSDTERNYNEKFSECEDLKRMLERGNSARENDEYCARENGDHCKNNSDGATGSTSSDSDLSQHGFKQFCEHLSKEISEENALEMQEILRDTLQNHALCREQETASLDAPHREWVPGIDYVILGKQPISMQTGSRLPRSVSFLIKHLKTGRKLHLKMLLTRSISTLYERCERELAILDQIGPHENVVHILHIYEGSMERFRKFLPVSHLNSDSLDELPSRTTFIVTEHMPTLASFINSSAELKSCGFTSVVLTHALYQLLSLICVLGEMSIYHNNINEDNVYINNELKPVLGNFEYATCSEGKLAEQYPAENDDDVRDYINVTHVTRGSSTSQRYSSTCCDLKQLCKMFDNILMAETPISTCSTEDTLTGSVPTVSPDVWRVVNSVLTQQQCPSNRECLQRVGFSMYGPSADEVKSHFQCRTYMQTRMLHLLSYKPKLTTKQPTVTGNDIEFRRRIRLNTYEIEAHFLCNITSKQLWDIRRTINH